MTIKLIAHLSSRDLATARAIETLADHNHTVEIVQEDPGETFFDVSLDIASVTEVTRRAEILGCSIEDIFPDAPYLGVRLDSATQYSLVFAARHDANRNHILARRAMTSRHESYPGEIDDALNPA